MDEETKIVVDMAKVLMSYCIRKDRCADCPFAITYNVCALNNPINYQVNKVKGS